MRTAGAIEFRQHVVEQNERQDATAIAEHLGFGEEERENRDPLLTL